MESLLDVKLAFHDKLPSQRIEGAST